MSIFKFFGVAAEWFIEDVLQIDLTPEFEQSRGQDITAHSTEAYLPVYRGQVKDIQPVAVGFIGTTDVDNDDTENDLLYKVFVYGKAVHRIDAIRIDGVDSTSTDWEDDKGGRWLHAIAFPTGMTGYDSAFLKKAGFKDAYKYVDCCCVLVRAEAGSEVVTSEPRNVRIDVTGKQLTSALLTTSPIEERSRNNAENLYHYLVKDSSGPRWPKERLDLNYLRKAAEACNEKVETFSGSGELQPLYTFDASVNTGLKVFEVIKLFRESMRAHMPFNHQTGKYEVIVDQDDNYEQSLEILDSDIVDGITVSESADVGQKVNQVIVKYPDKDQNGKMTEVIYPVEGSEIDIQWLAEDNHQRKTKKLNLPSCNNHFMAMQQAKIEAEYSREGLKASLVVRPRLYGLRVARVVHVTNRERGWNRKPFRILGKRLNRDLSSELALREHQPYIYDYHNTGEKPAIPDTTIDPRKLSKPSKPVIVDSDYGGKKATWTSAASQFDWQLEKSDETFVRSGESNTTSTELSQLVDGQEYIFYVRARNNIGRVSGWVESDPFIYVATEDSGELPDDDVSGYIEPPDIDPDIDPSNFMWKVIYDTTDHGSSPDLKTAKRGGLLDYRAGQLFVIPYALPNTTYYIWFGIVKREQTNENPTSWIKRVITTGGGIGPEYLSQQIKDLLESGVGEATRAKLDAIELNNLEANTQIEEIRRELEQNSLEKLSALAKVGEVEVKQASVEVKAEKGQAAAKEAKAAVVTESEARALQINEVKTDFEGNAATVQNQISTITTDLSSQASSISSLSSNVGYISSNYASRSYVSSRINGAEAGILQTLDSRFDQSSGVYGVQIKTAVDAANAAASKAEELAAGIYDDNGNLSQAFIDNVALVAIEVDGATIAAAISSYTVSAGGSTFTLEEIAQLSISADGNSFAGQWGVKARIGDLVHGVGFYIENGVTRFVASVNSFVIYDPSTGATGSIPFYVENGITYIDDARIKKLSVEKLDGDVTDIAAYDLSSHSISSGFSSIGASRRVIVKTIYLKAQPNFERQLKVDPLEFFARFTNGATTGMTAYFGGWVNGATGIPPDKSLLSMLPSEIPNANSWPATLNKLSRPFFVHIPKSSQNVKVELGFYIHNLPNINITQFGIYPDTLSLNVFKQGDSFV